MQIHPLAYLALLLLPAGAWCQTPVDIQALMTTDELQSTGINALTPAQLEALNHWLETHVVPIDQAVAQESQSARPGTEEARAAQTPNVRQLPAQVAVQPTQVEPSAPVTRAYGEREEFVDVVSLIRGPFTGWDGKTVFELENGQVYRQRRQGKWRTSLVDPEVRITKNFLGMFEMEIDGHSIGVTRVR